MGASCSAPCQTVQARSARAYICPGTEAPASCHHPFPKAERDAAPEIVLAVFVCATPPFKIAGYFETPLCESSLSMQDSRRNPKRRRRVPKLRFSEGLQNSVDLGAAGGTQFALLHGKSKAALDPA